MTLAAGSRLGPYEILAALGAGGMGEVYRARDPKLGRDVAIKVLPRDMANDTERLARFEREAQSLAALNHPNIITIYAIEESGGTRFLAMELVEGQELGTILSSGALSMDRFFAIAVPLSEALSAAHERGIVHRDLKPANVMVTSEGRVKVLDFGLAKKAAAASDLSASSTPTASRAELTSEGQVFGTVAYMSPEQARGEKVDARSDVFSLGVLLYQMLTGERPHKGRSAMDILTAILRDKAPSVTELRADVPPHLARVLRRCLEKDPHDRYQTSRDVFNELRELQAESSAPTGRLPSRELEGRRPFWKTPVLIAAAAALALAAAVFFVVRSGALRRAPAGAASGGEPGGIRSLAVLPLDNYSGDASQDFFAEGMTDELTAELATISKLRVISRGSAMQFKGKQRPPTPEIGKTLNVDAIIEGSVYRSGDRVRITAQLIDAKSDRHLWAKSFERSSRDVLALQDELASAIAREIHVQLTPAEQSRLTHSRAVNPQAYDAYLKGRYFFNRPSDENLKTAIARFEEAITLDPNFAPAHSGLSDAYLWAGYNEGFVTASEARPKAKAAAEKAIQLDDQAAEGHTSLATFKVFYEYDWEGSEREYRRAFSLNPNYAFAHDQFGLALAFQGRLDEAIAEGKQAAELDPLSPQIPLDNSIALAWKGDFDGARALVKRAEELDPAYFFAPWEDGFIDLQAGKIKESIPNFQKARAMDSPAFVSAYLAYAYAATGDQAAARTEVEELKKRSLRGKVTAFNMALASLGTRDRARAMDYLEQAVAEDSQWFGWLRNDKTFDPLRSDPRFAALVRKLKL